ncbi:GNAT family N-acetyltransferase [Pedobacter immunditicola]|uniref:GNAT family N-acetyltransferase n=1 Tax=Pedobacter immunditicola TaxID=3133440 RepID=UPI00309A19AE
MFYSATSIERTNITIDYIKLTDGSLPELSFIKELYEEAFPVQERRDWSSLLGLLNHSDMQVDLLVAEGSPIGFIILWKIQDWRFIEHFAVSTKVRGKGYGAEVVRYYLGIFEGRLLLEVEPAITRDACRRIDFYKRLGLSLINVVYRQPSYIENDLSYPMHLMGTQSLVPYDFQELIAEIKNKVYKKS